ncbi:MAG TPA: toprim domain-containing protein [Gammaproteobacteria bacterium]|nr:toprim domain-containing protein [Gammaproteobacteria bacterium]
MSNIFKQVSCLLAQHAEDVARYLLPQGKKIGHEWCAGSIHGEAGESLKICLLGEKAGVWCDFAEGSGHSGDLLDLWSAVRKIKLPQASKEAEQYLGMVKPKFEAYRPPKFVKPDPKKIKPVNTMSSVMNYLINERKLTRETIQAFQIGECENGREIIFQFIRDGELILRKNLSLDRPHGKKQIFVEGNCEPCLFGWHILESFMPNTRKIALVEGEIDCMSAYQFGIDVPTLSVPFGGGAGKKQQWIEYEFERLSVFDEIFLCFDPDKEGDLAVTDLIERLGQHRCRVVKLPYKDMNECLQNGVTREEIQKCFDEARTLDPEELKPAGYFVDQVIAGFNPPNGCEIGIAPPWEKTKGIILFRPSELSIWSGINGHGKSQFLGHLILHFINVGSRVCIASLELKPQRLLMRLTRQAAGLADPSDGYIRAIHNWYVDKLWLFDLVGTTKVERLLEVFLYARQRYGIDVFVIDSFMKCGIGEDDYNAQKAFIDRLCDFKNQHNCHIHLIMHPRKTDDETKIPGKLDFKGTGAITDLADNCFVIWRNKAKEEAAQIKSGGNVLDAKQQAKLDECDCIWRCDKQRNGEWEGKISLWFDPKSYQYLGHPKLKPIQFVEYKN